MRIVINVAIVLFLITPAFVQAQSHGSKEEKTKEEIQKLFSDLNEAITKKDRASESTCESGEALCLYSLR